MVYNFDKLTTVNIRIWNSIVKLLEGNTRSSFVKYKEELLRHTPICAIHRTDYTLQKHQNSYWRPLKREPLNA